MKNSLDINIIVNCPVSPDSIGGGDRIFIELGKGWNRLGHNVIIFGCEEGYGICKKNMQNVEYNIISNFSVKKYGLIFAYVFRIIKSLFRSISIKRQSIIYSSSDYLPDTIPAWRSKRKDKSLKWVAGLYLKAPNPLRKETNLSIRSGLYLLNQQISIILMKQYADLIFVLCDEDKNYLQTKGISSNKIKVISGGVDINYIKEIAPKQNISYDACFVGRFHKQKGLFDLIKSWEIVTNEKKNAQIAIIGWGDKHWTEKIEREIRLRNLQNNVNLLGFQDGKHKYEILKASKIFTFPSNYESWGIVAIEAMACGLPVIAYDLPIYKRNFPGGIKTVPVGDYTAFAKAILDLLEDKDEYNKIKKQALSMAQKYDWNMMAETTEQYLQGSLHL